MGVDAWLRDSARRGPCGVVLGRQLTGVVSWNLGDACNYRCSYCTQRRLADRSGTLADVAACLEALARLPGQWEIKLSGGEPFAQPGLLELARGLVQRGHLISIQTNLSAPAAQLEAFLEATRGALHVLSASLHLDYATAEQLVERYERWVRPYCEAHGARFHITSVATRARLSQLQQQVAPLLRQRGVVFKVQPEKVDGYVRHYSAAERQLLLELGGHNNTGGIEHNFQGSLCHAGARYLVIKSTGRAYRCYPASRVGGRHAELGSLRQGLRLLPGPKICPYSYCNCTVPIQRGMIDGWERPEPLAPTVSNQGE